MDHRFATVPLMLLIGAGTTLSGVPTTPDQWWDLAKNVVWAVGVGWAAISLVFKPLLNRQVRDAVAKELATVETTQDRVQLLEERVNHLNRVAEDLPAIRQAVVEMRVANESALPMLTRFIEKIDEHTKLIAQMQGKLEK